MLVGYLREREREREHKYKDDYEILQLSLCVSHTELSLFADYATEFIKTPASKVLLGCLKTTKKQPKL